MYKYIKDCGDAGAELRKKKELHNYLQKLMEIITYIIDQSSKDITKHVSDSSQTHSHGEHISVSQERVDDDVARQRHMLLENGDSREGKEKRESVKSSSENDVEPRDTRKQNIGTGKPSSKYLQDLDVDSDDICVQVHFWICSHFHYISTHLFLNQAIDVVSKVVMPLLDLVFDDKERVITMLTSFASITLPLLKNKRYLNTYEKSYHT